MHDFLNNDIFGEKFMRSTLFKLLPALFLAFSCLLACKKGSDIPPVEPKPIEVPQIVSDLKIDSVAQLFFTVTYKLAVTTTETGIQFATDSAVLAKTTGDSGNWKTADYNGSYYARPRFWSYPSQNAFWYRIYYKNEQGNKVYTKIYRQDLVKYLISNYFVVCGKGEYNQHPKDFFINFEGTPIGALDNALMVTAFNEDNDLLSYRAKINGIDAPTNKISLIETGKAQRNVFFDVPVVLPIGPANFELFYKGNLVYQTQITIVNGGLLRKIQPPVRMIDGQFFTHENNFYSYNVYFTTLTTSYFYRWNTSTNEWVRLPQPPGNFNYRDHLSAQSINGLIYFPPLYIRAQAPYSSTNPYYYDEVIWTFNPVNNSWAKIVAAHVTDRLQDRDMDVKASVAYQNKIYCVVHDREIGRDPINAVIKPSIKVFDVISKTWETYIELNDKSVWNYRLCLVDDRIYLLTSGVSEQQSASTSFKNELFELNLNSKKLIKKSWFNHKYAGTSNPALTAHKGKMYLYGGYNSTGYTSLYSSLFAVYTPDEDKWEPVSGYSYFTGWVSQNKGFLLSMGDKLYLGLGMDRYSNGNIHAAKINSSIFEVDIK